MKELGKHVVDFGEALNKDLNSLARSAKDGFHNIADTLFASQLVPAGGPNIQRMSIPDPPQTTHTKVTPERQRQIDALKNGEYIRGHQEIKGQGSPKLNMINLY